jgi:hypothetical protein
MDYYFPRGASDDGFEFCRAGCFDAKSRAVSSIARLIGKCTTPAF